MKPKTFFYTLIGILVALIIFGSAGYYFATKRLTDRTNQLKSTMLELAAADDQIAELTALKSRLKKIEPSLPLIEAALPKTKRQSEFLLQLQSLAASRGLSVPSVSIGAPGTAAGTSALPSATSQTAKAGDALVMPLTLQLSGSYDQLSGFLRDLERLNRYANVTSLTIAKADRSRTLSFTIGLNAYIKP